MAVTLGKAECGECGGTKVLVIKPNGDIWTKCLRCGFSEWEWAFSDNPDYLNYLAEHYNVTLEEIKKALAGKTKTPTEIQKTIVRQLETLNPYFVKLYGVKEIVAMDDGRTVRLHTKNNRVTINIDITYHRIPDVYEIKAYHVDGKKPDLCETVAHLKNVYCDQTDELIHRILHKNANVPLRIIEG